MIKQKQISFNNGYDIGNFILVTDGIIHYNILIIIINFFYGEGGEI